MDSFFDTISSGPLPSLSALLKSNDISYPVQQHLIRVYSALAATTLFSAFGAIFYLYTHVSPFLATIGSMVMLFSVIRPSTNGQYADRIPNLLAYGFFQGAALGSLVELALHVNPSILVQACAMTTMVFGSFAGVAMFSQRRSYLYLGGLLTSGMSWLLWSSLFNSWLLGSASLFDANLYMGLVLFSGYVVFDTQIVIERASSGDRDFVKHAADLFADVAAIFVRILVILLKNQQQPQRQEKKRRRA